jgi:glycosyltransferase involved in cell wall biosynthesis
LRILIAHNHYQQRGGEDIVVENETALLRKAGHEVETFIVSNDEISGFARKVQTAVRVLDNPTITDLFDRQITDFRPQVVHFHNFFPRLTPGSLKRSLDRGIPTLHTLHNFRLLCAAGTLFRQGRVCEDCVGSSWRLPAVCHGCYRGSPVGSFFVARIGRHYRGIFECYKRYLTLVTLTEFARSQMIRDGYDASRIVVKGNAAPDVGLGGVIRDRRIVFVGRLSPEKGADFLMRVARQVDAEFEIIGDGPERQQLAAHAPPNVVFLGWLDHDAVIERLKTAAVVAIPSRWYEGFPMVLAEAFSVGTPVFGSRHGALAELIEHGRSGMTLPVDDEAAWAVDLQRIIDDPASGRRLGQSARKTYEEKYAELRNVKQLISIYEDAIVRTAQNPDT